MTLSDKHVERFWGYVEKIAGIDCWLWTGTQGRHGYGVFKVRPMMYRAHRIAYELIKGEIPLGLNVCHKCDTPLCVRPDHLYVGTQKQNIGDSIRARRHTSCLLAERTHCPQGHEYSPGNVRYKRATGRQCRTCERERNRLDRLVRSEFWKKYERERSTRRRSAAKAAQQ